MAMYTDPEMESLFAECLDRATGGEPIDTILNDHPNEREWLQPMLESAGSIAAFAPEPDPSLKTVGRVRFHGAVRSHLLRNEEKARRGWLSGGLSPLARAWVGSAAVLVLTVGIGGGATVASASAMPESPLYGIKRLTERTRLAMTASEERRADLLLAYADERVRELTVMAEAGKVDQVERLRRDLVKQVELAQAERGISSIVAEPLSMAEASAPQSFTIDDASAGAASKASAPSAPMAEAGPSYGAPHLSTEESRAIGAWIQQRYQEHMAALAAAQQHASPSARASVTGALDDIRSRYLAVPDGRYERTMDPLGRIVLIQGVPTVRDGTWFLGGRSVTFVEGQRPETGDSIVMSGILSSDGSIQAVAVTESRQDSPSRDYVALQAPLVHVGEGRITVGDYAVVLPEGASLKAEVRLGMWLEVRGRVLADGALLADSVYVIGVYPGPFVGRP